MFCHQALWRGGKVKDPRYMQNKKGSRISLVSIIIHKCMLSRLKQRWIQMNVVILVTEWFNSRECLTIRYSPIKSPSATCPPWDRATQRNRPSMLLHVSLKQLKSKIWFFMRQVSWVNQICCSCLNLLNWSQMFKGIDFKIKCRCIRIVR